jgi:hypothetical protein
MHTWGQSLRRRFTLLVAAVLLLLACSSSNLRAQGQLLYEAIDLVNPASADIWQYRYTLSGFTFQAGEGFSVFFDHSNSHSLTPALAPGTGWDVLAVQPDSALQHAGFYDAQAESNNPSSIEHRISFVWTGQGVPGPQSFTIYNIDFTTRFSGQSVLVPEPSGLWLLAIGIPLWWTLRNVRRSTEH